MTGALLDELYRSFPSPRQVDTKALYEAAGLRFSSYDEMGVTVEKIKDGDGEDKSEELKFLHRHVVKWLVDEGFVRDVGSRRYVLTSKSLSVMNAHPASLGGSLGAKLRDAVSDAGGEAGRAAVSETVGMIIGGVVRGLSQ